MVADVHVYKKIEKKLN